ncbi:hypothetical protein T492DRAFT_168916 [Pavlovales sp. CCMP2436]|nr:hypothetical protein T492DRAFT_168916 [Pavlovales sp. CCMP2436]
MGSNQPGLGPRLTCQLLKRQSRPDADSPASRMSRWLPAATLRLPEGSAIVAQARTPAATQRPPTVHRSPPLSTGMYSKPLEPSRSDLLCGSSRARLSVAGAAVHSSGTPCSPRHLAEPAAPGTSAPLLAAPGTSAAGALCCTVILSTASTDSMCASSHSRSARPCACCSRPSWCRRSTVSYASQASVRPSFSRHSATPQLARTSVRWARRRGGMGASGRSLSSAASCTACSKRGSASCASPPASTSCAYSSRAALARPSPTRMCSAAAMSAASARASTRAALPVGSARTLCFRPATRSRAAGVAFPPPMRRTQPIASPKVDMPVRTRPFISEPPLRPRILGPTLQRERHIPRDTCARSPARSSIASKVASLPRAVQVVDWHTLISSIPPPSGPPRRQGAPRSSAPPRPCSTSSAPSRAF